MRKLSRYLMGDFLTIFCVAMLLITFAFSIGAIYKAIDIMARGIPVGIVGRFFVYNLPYSLAYTIPISALFATLLLFGRLSAESEIAAMKSGGLSLWQIASPVLLFSVGLVCVCLVNNGVLYPKTTYANRKLIKGMGIEDPIKLLEEGRFIREFPGYMIYVGKKSRNLVRDLVVYEVDRRSGKVTGTVRADSGVMSVDEERALLKIDLSDVRIEIPDANHPDDASKTRYVSASRYPIRVNFNELLGASEVSKKRKHMTLPELFHRIRNYRTEFGWMAPRDQEVERSRCRVEAHQKICLAIAPFTFVLLAIPLGIRSHRKESSVGMLLSLGVMFAYYLFLIVSDTFDDRPELRPWLFPWIPIVAGQVAGIVLMRRAN